MAESLTSKQSPEYQLVVEASKAVGALQRLLTDLDEIIDALPSGASMKLRDGLLVARQRLEEATVGLARELDSSSPDLETVSLRGRIVRRAVGVVMAGGAVAGWASVGMMAHGALIERDVAAVEVHLDGMDTCFEQLSAAQGEFISAGYRLRESFMSDLSGIRELSERLSPRTHDLIAEAHSILRESTLVRADDKARQVSFRELLRAKAVLEEAGEYVRRELGPVTDFGTADLEGRQHQVQSLWNTVRTILGDLSLAIASADAVPMPVARADEPSSG